MLYVFAKRIGVSPPQKYQEKAEYHSFNYFSLCELKTPFWHYFSSQSRETRLTSTPILGLRVSRYSNRHALRNTRERNMRSKIRWFTEFCNSHYVSHFAAFFIVARAKRSVVKSCFLFVQENQDSINMVKNSGEPFSTESELTKDIYRAHSVKVLNPLLMIQPQVHLRLPCYDLYFL